LRENGMKIKGPGASDAVPPAATEGVDEAARARFESALERAGQTGAATAARELAEPMRLLAAQLAEGSVSI
jgi:hypothetical protein